MLFGGLIWFYLFGICKIGIIWKYNNFRTFKNGNIKTKIWQRKSHPKFKDDKMELEDKQSEAPRTKPFRSQMFHIAIHDQSVEEKNNLPIDGVTKWPGSAGHVSQKHWFWSLRTIWVCYLSIRKRKKWLKLASAFRDPGKFSMYRLEGRWHEEILAKQVLVGGVEIQSRQHVTIALENVLRTQGLNVQCNMSSKYIF